MSKYRQFCEENLYPAIAKYAHARGMLSTAPLGPQYDVAYKAFKEAKSAYEKANKEAHEAYRSDLEARGWVPPS